MGQAAGGGAAGGYGFSDSASSSSNGMVLVPPPGGQATGMQGFSRSTSQTVLAGGQSSSSLGTPERSPRVGGTASPFGALR